MSSALVAEPSQAHAFSTTCAFKTKTGFNPKILLSMHVVSHSQHPRKPVPARPSHVLKSSSSTPLSSAGDHPPTTSSSLQSTYSDHGQVGWKGLLEISRNSGTPGVMGLKCMDDENSSSKDCQIEVCATAHTNSDVRRLVKSVVRGLKACQEPEKPKEGMGGTYFFANENGKKVAILKPCDEEPLAPNNPKGYVGRALGDPGWKPTVRVGEAAMREVAAYLLDHDGFAKVPTSVLVRACHPIFCYNNRMSSVRASSMDVSAMDQLSLAALDDMTEACATHTTPVGKTGCTTTTTTAEACTNLTEEACTTTTTAAACTITATAAGSTREPLPMKLGSLQEFVSSECDTSDMGPSRFSTSDIHRIGILDIRLFNTDRHAGNMLVRSPSTTSVNFGGNSSSNNISQQDEMRELIPIDHGFCLPETLEAPYFEWLHWPQAMQPFSQEELVYIQNLDVEADKELLRKELPNLRPECLCVLQLGTTLLKRGAEAGLTLFDIASIITRPFGDVDEEPSSLERICMEAKQQLEEEELEGSAGGSSEDAEDSEGDVFHLEMAYSSSPALHGMASSDAPYSSEGRPVLDLHELFAAVRAHEALKRSYAGHGRGRASSFSPASRSQSSNTGSSLSSVNLPTESDLSSSLLRITPVGEGGGAKNFRSGLSTMGGGEATATPSHLGPSAWSSTAVAAKSLCFADSILSRQRHSLTRINTMKKVKVLRRSKTARHASPPLPLPSAFGSDAAVMSFSNMDPRQWNKFMGLVDSKLQASIAEGNYKNEACESVSSCPKF